MHKEKIAVLTIELRVFSVIYRVSIDNYMTLAGLSEYFLKPDRRHIFTVNHIVEDVACPH